MVELKCLLGILVFIYILIFMVMGKLYYEYYDIDKEDKLEYSNYIKDDLFGKFIIATIFNSIILITTYIVILVKY